MLSRDRAASLVCSSCRLQPLPLVAERLIRRAVFPEAIRGAIGRKVPHQSEVAAPDLGIVGILGHAEHGEGITHQNWLLRAVPAVPRPAAIHRLRHHRLAQLPQHRLRHFRSERRGSGSCSTICATAASRPNSFTSARRLSVAPLGIPSIIATKNAAIVVFIDIRQAKVSPASADRRTAIRPSRNRSIRLAAWKSSRLAAACGHLDQIVRLGHGQPIGVAPGAGDDVVEPPGRVRGIPLARRPRVVLQQIERLETGERLGQGLEFRRPTSRTRRPAAATRACPAAGPQPPACSRRASGWPSAATIAMTASFVGGVSRARASSWRSQPASPPAAFISSASSSAWNQPATPPPASSTPSRSHASACALSAGLQADQPASDAQQRAGGIRSFPLGRRGQFLRGQVRTLRAHLLAGMGDLQLDHLAAHAGIDRIDLQQPARKPGSLLVSLARHRRVGRLKQHLAVVREALDRLVHQPVPVLEQRFLAITPDQLEHGRNVFGVGRVAALQVEDDRDRPKTSLALDLGMFGGEVREVAVDNALRQHGLPIGAAGGEGRRGGQPALFRRLPVAACLRCERLDAVTLQV